MIYLDYCRRVILLSDERMAHISERHPETEGGDIFIKSTLENPDFVQEGNRGEILSIKKFRKTPISANKYCIVVYKCNDSLQGFIVTVYFTRRPSLKRKIIWKK
jgi:hypothetical protein